MNWKIEHWLVKPSEGELQNVVVSVCWRCSDERVVDGKTHYGTTFSQVSFSAPEAADFIPLDQLTDADLLEWVWTLGGIDKGVTEAAVAQQIENSINPPLISPPFPWAVVPSPVE